jgi:hypothetical protein
MAGSRDAVDALLRDRGLRRTGPALTAEALLRGAHASDALEGSASSLDDVRSGSSDPSAAAALRVSTELLGLVPVLGRTPLQALARLHTVAGTGTAEEDRLGRPVDPAAAERLAGVASLLTSPTGAPAMVLAAVVHAEIVTAAPFASYNGVVARAVERMVLVARGVDPASVTVPERGHLDLRPAYETGLERYAGGTTAGVRAWLLYAAEAYVAGAEASPLRG